MAKKNRFDAINLHQLGKMNFNRHATLVIKDVIGNLIEGLHNYLLARVFEEYVSLVEYLEAF